MKKSITTVFFMVMLTLTLTACMPPGYSKEHVKEITKAHSAEATDWFKANLPEAKVKSAEAYKNGIDLFAAISGTYTYEGGTYEYIYDYYNGNMYLGYEYVKAAEVAQRLMEDFFGSDVNGVNLHTPRFSFDTMCENDNGGRYPNSSEYGSIISTNWTYILPAGADAEEYGRLMIEDGLGDSCYLNIYCDTIPAYDRHFFDEFPGIASVYYSVKADFEFDDIYKVWYRADKAIYYHLRLTKLNDTLYGGYYYEIIDTFDENGEVVEHTDDSDDYDPSTFYTENGDGSFTLCIPPGHAQAVLFGPKGKYYNVRHTSDGEVIKINLDGWDKSSFEYDKDYDDFIINDIVLPKSKLNLYMRINASSSDDGKYEIVVE